MIRPDPDLCETRKIDVTIKGRLLYVLLPFDKLDDFLGQRPVKDARRMPGSQPKFRIIPRDGKILENEFDRCLSWHPAMPHPIRRH
jgi:hypothetical protein